MWNQRQAQTGIILAGCLGMIYTQLTMSSATIEYARSLDANAFHIGLLGALPAATLFTQFLAAVVANHLRYRRRLWLSVAIVQRSLFIPLAIGTWLFPSALNATWLWLFIGLTAGNHLLLHFCTPLWLSWMGDYLPRERLNRIWGSRQFWMQWAGALALFVGAVHLANSGLETRYAFSIHLLVGAVFGIADLLMFLKVEEPPVTPIPIPRLRTVFSAPFQDRNFRSFIAFTSFWQIAANTGAPFISFFLLTRIGLSVQSVMLLWTCSWAGGAILCGKMGHLSESVGNRPLLVLCTAFKSLNMIALLFLPRDPDLAFWILVPVFVVDAIMNAGMAIANNGFLLKNSPPANRTMFIAAGTAIAGLAGGATALLTGSAIVSFSDVSIELNGRDFTAFHMAFLLSILLRLLAVPLVLRVREDESKKTREVVTQLVGMTPFRTLRFPVGLYRSFPPTRNRPTETETEEPAERPQTASKTC
ncbi:MFS transporter [Thalassoroseus pseudoceratinae]|uniref:MFS transporter n=1 Tax=Thalassoroseus pseudoceratinae TaxID=2713176 RepID=UPI001421C556|nr:MFS transporter [Thalassoroseus pseudoceratinae]